MKNLKKIMRSGIGKSLLMALLRWVLPRNRFGDKLFALAKFRLGNGRWPTKTNGYSSDFFHFLKVSREADLPLRSSVSCKLGVRDYIAKTVGKRYCVPVLALLETPDQAMAFDYPSRCVIKPTHLSGPILYRSRGEALPLGVITSWFRRSHYHSSRERNYLPVLPRVIVEPYLDLGAGPEVKASCLRGEPKVFAWTSEWNGLKQIYRYGPDWRFLDCVLQGGEKKTFPRPSRLEEMLRLARALSREFLFIRVDFLEAGDDLYVGELTNFPGGAVLKILPGPSAEVYNRAFFGAQGFDLRDFPEMAS